MLNLLVIKIGSREFVKTTCGAIDLARIVRFETTEGSLVAPKGSFRFWLEDGAWLDRVPAKE